MLVTHYFLTCFIFKAKFFINPNRVSCLCVFDVSLFATFVANNDIKVARKTGPYLEVYNPCIMMT